jgi:hypothetical protein
MQTNLTNGEAGTFPGDVDVALSREADAEADAARRVARSPARGPAA